VVFLYFTSLNLSEYDNHKTGFQLKSIIFSFLQILFISAQPVIKSLNIYSGSPSDLPVGQDFTIEFDVKSEFSPELKLKFLFCDSQWNPYERYELENRGHNFDEALEYERLPNTVQGADFHFKRKYPSQRVTFPFSGKWIMQITDMFENDVYAEGYFIVAYDSINTNVKITKDQSGSFSYLNNLNKTIRLSTSFMLTENMDPFRLSHIEIIENHKLFYPIIIERGQNDRERYFEWDASRKMMFVARDIYPGNEYRKLDLRNKSKYAYPDSKAQFEGIETSRFFDKGNTDFNGGKHIMNYKDENSEYMNITFQFRPHEKPSGSNIFVVGAFSNWIVYPENKMKEDNGLYSLTAEIKRGQYDYQYVTGQLTDGYVENIDWNIYEGNFFETSNIYTVLVYYKSNENGEYEQIISHKIVNFGGL